MSEHGVRFDGIWKKFSRGEYHDSLRDLIPSALRRALGRRPADAAELSGQEFWALRDVSFEVRPGEALGIIGPNGAGKSTILKVLTRLLEPTRGHCEVRGRLAALIEVAAGFHPDLTGRENVFLQGAIIGMKRADITRKFDEIVDFAGVSEFIDTPVKHYSTGMNTRLGFAIAAHLDPDVLLIDEVLSVGDAAFSEKCMDRMRALLHRGVPLVFISHNLSAVQDICTRTLVMDHGTVRFDGPPARAIQEYRLVPWTNSAARQPSATEIRIVRAELLDEHGEPSTVFQTAGTMRVRVHYEALTPVQKVSIRVDIHRGDGIHCAGISTMADRFDLDVLEGVGCVELAFPRIPLLPGFYLGSVAILDTARGVAFDRKSRMYPFSVVSECRDLGVVYLDHEWSRRPSSPGPEEGPGAAHTASGVPDLQPPRRHAHPTNAFVRFEKEWVEQSVPECFAERARRWNADRVAISGTDRDLSYRELDRLSDQVARAIVSRRGAQPEPVALLFEHEAPVPAVMLGVLKAGKFFVPLDPSYPIDRNRYVLRDSQAELLITNERNLPLASSMDSSGRLLNLDDIASAPTGDYPKPAITPDDLAYVLYTSGSTGEPKGVMRTHRGLLHNVMRATNGRHICSDDRNALLFSYSFSAAIGNTFTTLFNGATLLPFNLRELGVTRLADWLIEREVTHFHTVPTVFRQLTDVLTGEHAFPRLRLIQLGGETMFAKDVERFKKHFGANCLLTVGMGTTESGHIFDLGFDKDTECPTDLLPVGYPVEDTEVFLVDEKGERVGLGCVGEIAVRGSFVSPGYWRRPELTAKKFRPDPRSGPDGGNTRLYLTGDLGRMLPDGCVFHVGRNDARVRIRSQSVEIPEVEAALLHVPGVSEVAVTAEEDPQVGACLAAYLVLSAGMKPSASALRQAIGEKLPAYMVPSTIVVLDTLPLLPNGKVDREALAVAKPTRLQEHAFVAPRTPAERTVAAIWADVLGITQVGVDENFFDLGGHSLLTMRVCSRIEKAFGTRIPPATILQSPTVEQIARLLIQDVGSTPSSSSSSLVAVQPHGSRPPFFWVHGENSNAFLPRFLGPEQPLYGLLQQSRDGTRARHTRVEDIAAYYLREIRSVRPSGPYYLGGFCVGGVLAFEVAQQLRSQGEEVALLVLLDPPGPGYSFTPRPRLLPKASDAFKKLACRAYSMIGADHPIPASLRILYINDVHSRARRAYVPRVYEGKVVVFRTEEAHGDLRPVWRSLVSGDLDIHELPGRHEEIVFHQDQVHSLGTQLRACLDGAQSSAEHVVASV